VPNKLTSHQQPMDPKLIAHGAEAKIYLMDDTIIKYRLPKSYRISEIDVNIRRKRTRTEMKVLERLAANQVSAPKLLKIDECSEQFDKQTTIYMTNVPGMNLKDVILCLEHSEGQPIHRIAFSIPVIFNKLGKLVRKVHACGVVHGDLTTANFILADDLIYVIDFGLSYFSTKEEDKAVDLYLLEKAVRTIHKDEYMDDFYDGYGINEQAQMRRRLNEVRKRGRKIGM
ncbi:Serine/threonine protein kinase, partial [Trachipleistophora hominis]